MIDLDGIPVFGVSIGGFASTLDLPEQKVCVDLGQLIDRTVARETVLITHGHADHVGSFAQHVAQRGLRRLPPATYYVPPGLDADLEELLGVWRAMDHGALRATIRVLEPGEDLVLRKDLVVRPFRTVHRVVSQGYLFEEIRTRLDDRFQGASTDEIRAARARGEQVNAEHRIPLLAVTGDTTIEGIADSPEVLGAPRIIMEATFLDDRISPKQSRERGHVHIADIAAIADDFACDALLLNHISPRHSREAAEKLVREALPAHLAERTRVMVGEEL